MEEKKDTNGKILIKDIETEMHDSDLNKKISQVEVGTAWAKC